MDLGGRLFPEPPEVPRLTTCRHPFDIVHITQSPFPEDPRPRREAAAAAELGVRVAVIALRTHAAQPRVARWGGIVVVRLSGRKRRGGPAAYITDYLDFVARARALVASSPRFRMARIVHVHTLPDFLVAAATPAKRAGARVILDMHEILPEFTRSKFPGLLGLLGERLARHVERWSRRRADVVVTVNRPIQALLATRPASKDESLVVIHNSPDPGELSPGPSPRSIGGNGLQLVYHGTLTKLYGLDIAIHAVADAVAGGMRPTLDIFGDGPERSALSALAGSLDLADVVRIHGPVSMSRLAELLPAFSAGFVPTRLDVMTQYSLSTKLLEYVHLRIPLIAPRLPTYLSYIPESAAWFFTPNDPRSATEAIRRFAEAPPAERARRADDAAIAARAFDWKTEASALKQVYRRLLGGELPR